VHFRDHLRVLLKGIFFFGFMEGLTVKYFSQLSSQPFEIERKGVHF
jgi:hypothetical protein